MLLQCLLAGYVTALVGFLPNVYILKQNRKKNWFHCLWGFCGGFVIAFICFNMLPMLLFNHNTYFMMAVLLGGVLFGAFLEEKGKTINTNTDMNTNTHSIFSVFVVLVDGFIVGALFILLPLNGLKLAGVFAMHCFSLGLGTTCSENSNKPFCWLRPFLLSIPMALGGFLGGLIVVINPFAGTLLVGFCCGVAIYSSCINLIPESKPMGHTLANVVASCLGLVFSILLTAK